MRRIAFGRFDLRMAVIVAGLALGAVSGAQTVSKVSVSPASVVGGTGASGMVTLSAKAGSSGVSVALSSSSGAATVGQSVVVEQGKTSATFKVTTVAVASDTNASITAMVGDSTKSATLVVKAPTLTSFAISPSSVAGGKSVTATAKISSAAPDGGLMIGLASNNSALTAPESLSIAAGAKSGTATLETSTVGIKTTAKVTATLGHSSMGESVTIQPLSLVSLTLDPSSVAGGSNSTATLTVSGPAPAAGLTVPLKSSVSTIVVPASVTVAAAATTASFTITTKSVKTKSSGAITARLGNTVAATLTLTAAPINPFAGKYSGSFYSTTPDLGTVNLMISSAGVLDGGSTDIWSSDHGTSTISGTVSNTGVVALTLTSQSGTQTAAGTFTITNGLIVGSFPTLNATIWINQDGKPLEYAGSWSGTFTNSNQDTGTTNIKITNDGVLTGTGKNATTGGTGTFTGTIDSTGVISVTFKSSNGTTTSNSGGAAYNASGQLVIYLVSAGGASTTTIVTLTKSGGGA